jgi:hypothetical protein
MVAQKISELKLEESEHKLVIDALKEVNDPTRKYVCELLLLIYDVEVFCIVHCYNCLGLVGSNCQC